MNDKFIEKGIPGGVSQYSNRYGKTNNKYMADQYDHNEQNSYLIYFDISNLYGDAMRMNLQYGGFEWVDIQNLYAMGLMNLKDDSYTGYIFEKDFEYDTKLQDLHKGLPLCTEPFIIPISKNSKLKTKLDSKKIR